MLTSVNAARTKARDVNKKSDLKQLEIALEFYYDNNEEYPNSNTGCGTVAWSSSANCPTTYIQGLVPAYIPILPLPTVGNYVYSARGVDNNQSYKLTAQSVESETVSSSGVWAHCPFSCTSEPGTWCSTRTEDYPNWYSISTGGARCKY